ncbi:cuticular protein RR-2 [Spodoptera litura]|uniref:Cuticular protein RR-2 n=1 Tax=Spodoptera litura TaxID=69820 RepID=A0A4U7B9P5_SPOLT|nr:cuticular protein RR-2 [Spodoptera litura]
MKLFAIDDVCLDYRTDDTGESPKAKQCFFNEHFVSRNGPILFPNDAPPPPPTPLIVTSRPLIESIARSELNPNNSVAAQSQYHQVQFRPDYLTRTRSYKPFAYGGPSTPVYDYRPPNVGYIATTERPEQENFYREYEGDNYAFSYTVKDHKTGDDFSHSQQSTGSATNGEYRVRLPDGRMQIVSYTADENGYNAKVRYDEHSTVDNTVDVDVTKGNIYRPPTPVTYKHIHPLYNDNQDSLENEEYIHQRYNEANIVKSSIAADRPTSAYNNIPHNYYGAKQNDFQNYKQQIETTKPVNKDRVDDLTDTNNEFLKHYHEKLSERNKLQRTKDEDYFKFSQEIADYSSELSHGNDHHKSKFAEFENNEGEPNGKVTPSYEELKELFVGKENRQRNAVSTVRPNDDVTESIVVAITPRKSNLYTNVNYYNNLISATPSPFPYSAHSPTTPSSYLYSTIANLKHRLTFGHKPVLSHQYINKINKYLSFK